MVINPGERIHVITRKLIVSSFFREDEHQRFFAGVVKTSSEHALRAEGYEFVSVSPWKVIDRRPEVRTCVFGIADAGLIIHVLPEAVKIEELRYQVGRGYRMVLTDDSAFSMNMDEFHPKR